MDGPLLDALFLKRVEILVKDLDDVHGDALVYLLPQMRTENLNEENLEHMNLAVHEDACEIELDLEANVHVGSVDRG